MSRLQNYFSSEFIASGLSTEFYHFISKITQAKSKTEEASHVTEELTNLNSKMGLPDVSSSKMKDYIIRLIHCYMLGYKVNFGIIYAIMATQSGETEMDRRVGYLACTLFLKRNHALGIMLINTLQRDLKSQNFLDRCAALNTICYLEHEEMLDNILDLVIQSMDFPKQAVRKKAVKALYFLYKRSNMDIKRIEPTLRKALEDKDTSVVFSALSVWKMILIEHATEFKDLLPVFYAIHRQIIEKRIHKSFLYHGVLAPWAQIECLQIYKIYHDLNIGSPQDFYNTIVDCLHSVEKKVDAAFAIVLECVKLLSSMDPILLGSLSDNNPFDVLVSYLHANNNNLRYLGVLGMSYVDESFWKEDWLNGALLASIIRTSFEDDTILAQAIENLDAIINSDILRIIGPAILEALNKNHDCKSSNTMIGYWLINRIRDYKTDTWDEWSVQTMMTALAEMRKNLEDEYVEAQCNELKEVLTQETSGNALRKASVETSFELLKKTNSDQFSPFFIQFMFWTLGENGYIHSDIDIMKQLQKWIQIIQDDYLQIYGLQAIKQCMIRSKTWLSGFEKLLKDHRRSSVPEKQEIAKELLVIIKDANFERELQENDSILYTPSFKMSNNPNQPKGIGRFMDNLASREKNPVII
ncbi:MAG: adaptin N terminal region-domain-containing protein [Benjaminiella poitrasii]|nr:MAG: adaptin N terminal region-domain-containing protein [Benjaminiella poitrasii]